MIDYKAMCIQQGYVLKGCKMDGQMAWLLVNAGKIPCEGCAYNRKDCEDNLEPDKM